MPDHAGTVERVGLELSAALGRVPQALGPDQVLETFTRFGVEFPPQLLAHAGFETARGASVQAAADLRTATNELLNAVSGGDAVQIVAKGAQLTAANAAVAGTFGGLSTQLQAAAPSLPGVTAAQVATLTADFPRKLFDFLVVEQLDIVPAVGATMTFLGLVDRAYHAADPAHPTSAAHEVASLRLDRLGPLLTNPAQHFSDLYGWGTGTFDGHLLFPAIRDLVARMGLPAAYDGGSAPSVQAFALDLKTAAGSTPGIATEVLLPIGGGIDHPLAVPHPAWSGHLKATATLAAATSGTVRPPLAITLRPPSGEISGEAELRLEAKPADPFVLIGAAGSSRLEVGELAAALGFDITWNSAAGEATLDPFARAELKHGKLVIDTSSGDGFVSHLLSGAGRIEAGFQVGATWSATRGVQFVGSSTLEIALPIHVTIGPIELPALYLVLGVQGGGFSLELSGDIKALLGPLTAIVHRLGAVAHLTFPAGGGNMGPAQLGFGFKPPSGVGLRVDAGPITGGGFLAFDEPKGEYFGALELSFEGLFSLKAVGIVTTKLPNGGDGFALLILVTAEFVPVQLGFGFTLLGVGGLLGVNRTVSTDALRQGVRSGSIESVLFPPDVVGNITQIVSDLKSFFPIADGHFVVAPMGKLGWGTPTLISLELGVVIDIPSPQLTILGVLRCLLPEEDAPLLALQVNFAGGIDFDRGLIWFDASLFDSRLLVYTLSGDMALRIGWGDEPVFVVSVGGFHPAFKEVPSDLTGMKRLTIALMSGNNPRLVAESYFAVTSNTVQSGAKVELYAAAGSFNVHGYLGYDLLVQFDPFHFVADLYAGLALRWGDDVICSLDVSCELSGPAPWHAKGHASLKLTPLGPRVSIGFDETWGDDAPALPQQTEDVLAKIATAVGDDRSWQATLPANTSQTVSLRAVDQDGDMVLLHPFGVLSVSQKVAPLDFQIDRFGNKKPVGDTKYEMTHAGGGTEDLREEFAVANFITLNDSQKLSRKSFEKLKSGLRFGVADGSATGATVHKDVNYEFRYVHRKRMTSKRIVGLLKELFDIMVHGGAVTRNALSVANRRPGGNGPAPVEIPDGAYHVVSVIDLLPHGAGAAVHTQAEAYALQDELVGADPALAGTLQVVAAHELAEAA